MHRRYNACCPPKTGAALIGSCCPLPPIAGGSARPGAIPESARLIAQRCPEMWVTTNEPISCANGDAASSGTTRVQKIRVPTTTGTLPIVQVGTTLASVTTQYKATQVLNNASDPYDPATRFAQYFPPQPPVPPCPERIPNPAPPDRPCVPNMRFHGSEWEHANQAPAPAPA